MQTPFALDVEGYLTIPTQPGLGVVLDRERLTRVAADPTPLFTP
jgi:D-galactarolactone cycloisomerase